MSSVSVADDGLEWPLLRVCNGLRGGVGRAELHPVEQRFGFGAGELAVAGNSKPDTRGNFTESALEIFRHVGFINVPAVAIRQAQIVLVAQADPEQADDTRCVFRPPRRPIGRDGLPSVGQAFLPQQAAGADVKADGLIVELVAAPVGPGRGLGVTVSTCD
ncbi:MAG: hypothetical protein O3B24_10560 [Verrucomicrobia bacterium]|nr:hypothetical protein [Verrucomicrobiota bacterium]